MKAYVIKNNEGKYCQISFNGWMNFVSELCCAYIYHSQQGAEKLIKCHELEDCEVVEITIAEGDLEEENRELKAKLETAEYWNRKYDDLLEQFHNYKLKIFEYAQRLMSLGKAFEPDVVKFLELTKEDVDRYINTQLDFTQQAKESEKDEKI